MKKGKMKDYERIYIEHSKASVEEIAKELDRPISTIKKWIAKTATKLVNEVFVESTQPTKPISKPEPLTKSLFVRPKVNDKKSYLIVKKLITSNHINLTCNFDNLFIYLN
jgi:IS30 family transposase